MKTFHAILFACAIITLLQNVTSFDISFGKGTGLKLVEAFSPELLSGINTFLRENDTEIFPDPYDVPNFSIVVNNLELGDLILSTNINVCDAILSGHSGLFTETSLGSQWPNPLASFRIFADLPIVFSGLADLEITATQGGGDNFVSSMGEFEFELHGPYVGINVIVNIELESNKFTLSEMTIDLGFDCIAINMDNLTYNDEEVDLGAISAQLQPQFDIFWANTRVTVEPIAQLLANLLTQDCLITEIQALDFTCITGTTESFFANDVREEIMNLFKFKNNQVCPVPIGSSTSSNLRSVATCVQPTQTTPKTTDSPGSASTFKFTTISFVFLFIFSYNTFV